MQHCPSSSVALALALFSTALVTVAGCSAPAPPATPAINSPRASSDLAPREAFVAHLESCASSSSSSSSSGISSVFDDGSSPGDGGRREACAAAFALRGEASTGELARWRDVAWFVCSELSSAAAIAVCRGVAELSLSGPLEDHARAREALGRGCHMHGDYASCVRLHAFGGSLRIARTSSTSG